MTWNVKIYSLRQNHKVNREIWRRNDRQDKTLQQFKSNFDLTSKTQMERRTMYQTSNIQRHAFLLTFVLTNTLVMWSRVLGTKISLRWLETTSLFPGKLVVKCFWSAMFINGVSNMTGGSSGFSRRSKASLTLSIERMRASLISLTCWGKD